MKSIDTKYAEGSFLKDLTRFLKQRKRIRKQNTFCWCPVCKEDLCSNNSFLSDTDEVRYRCSNCGTYSHWNFDIAPSPILEKYYIPNEHFAKA